MIPITKQEREEFWEWMFLGRPCHPTLKITEFDYGDFNYEIEIRNKEIFNNYESCKNVTRISERYGLSKQTIRNIINQWRKKKTTIQE